MPSPQSMVAARPVPGAGKLKEPTSAVKGVAGGFVDGDSAGGIRRGDDGEAEDAGDDFGGKCGGGVERAFEDGGEDVVVAGTVVGMCADNFVTADVVLDGVLEGGLGNRAIAPVDAGGIDIGGIEDGGGVERDDAGERLTGGEVKEQAVGGDGTGAGWGRGADGGGGNAVGGWRGDDGRGGEDATEKIAGFEGFEKSGGDSGAFHGRSSRKAEV